MPPLRRDDLQPDPVRQFARWYHDAMEARLPLPDGMTLATVDEHGRPSSRVVLLKSFDESGFVFYTNYRSRKALELAGNPAAALCFWWPSLDRQVRIEGSVARVTEAESDAYFATRPRGSQIGAWASDQSRVVDDDRSTLEDRARELEQRWRGQDIPRPPQWGGFRLRHEAFEFWQNRDDRLHDRFRYTRWGEEWRIERLAP